MSLAWHIGALSRPLKKFPTLDSMLVKPKTQPRQSWQHQFAIAQMWAGRKFGKIGRMQ